MGKGLGERSGPASKNTERERGKKKGRGDNTRSGIIEGCETGNGRPVPSGRLPRSVPLAPLAPLAIVCLVLVLAAAIHQIAETGLQPLYDIIDELYAVSDDLV